MSMINTKIKPFKKTCIQKNGEFIEITEKIPKAAGAS